MVLLILSNTIIYLFMVNVWCERFETPHFSAICSLQLTERYCCSCAKGYLIIYTFAAATETQDEDPQTSLRCLYAFAILWSRFLCKSLDRFTFAVYW